MTTTVLLEVKDWKLKSLGDLFIYLFYFMWLSNSQIRLRELHLCILFLLLKLSNKLHNFLVLLLLWELKKTKWDSEKKYHSI